MGKKVSDVIFGPRRETKGRILIEMKKGEVTAQKIVKKLRKAQNTISEHLVELEKERLIESRVEKKVKYYKLTDKGKKIAASLEVLFQEI